MRLLFLTARFPSPPLKGDQVRAYHQLRLLSQHHAITLLSFEDGMTPQGRAQVEAWCERVVTVPLSGLDRARGLLTGAFSHLPLQTLIYQSPAMERAVREALTHKFDVAHVQLARMAPYLENAPLPRVVDLIDALSLNVTRRADKEGGLKARVFHLEARRMRLLEHQLCAAFEAATVVSHIDRDAIGDFDNLHVNPNGVSADEFAFVEALDARREAKTLIFTGNMGYFPNADAAVWFAREVLPLVRVPGVKLRIVGANPGPNVTALEAENVTVTGFVPSMRDELSQAALAVVPMRAGSGIQNKVIEAMACGTPVVATPYALGGLSAHDGEHLLIASDAQTLADSVTRLLGDACLRATLSVNARRLVEEAHSWEKSVDTLERVYESVVEHADSSIKST